ncbi:MAG: hypothetical protein ACKOFG_08670, partial [Limnohabitans sp.]
MSAVLQSFIAGRWIGQQAAQPLRSAIDGHTVAQTHAEALDFGEAVQYARTVGMAGVLMLDFQERAQRLKALAKYLTAHKETLYAMSAHTGAKSLPPPKTSSALWRSRATRSATSACWACEA